MIVWQIVCQLLWYTIQTLLSCFEDNDSVIKLLRSIATLISSAMVPKNIPSINIITILSRNFYSQRTKRPWKMLVTFYLSRKSRVMTSSVVQRNPAIRPTVNTTTPLLRPLFVARTKAHTLSYLKTPFMDLTTTLLRLVSGHLLESSVLISVMKLPR